MLSRLKYPDDEHPDPRGELDQVLGITSWQTPLLPTRSNDVPTEAPMWWQGDEEASQSFFTAMKIDPSKLG
jgi:hypothetical protein